MTETMIVYVCQAIALFFALWFTTILIGDIVLQAARMIKTGASATVEWTQIAIPASWWAALWLLCRMGG